VHLLATLLLLPPAPTPAPPLLLLLLVAAVPVLLPTDLPPVLLVLPLLLPAAVVSVVPCCAVSHRHMITHGRTLTREERPNAVRHSCCMGWVVDHWHLQRGQQVPDAPVLLLLTIMPLLLRQRLMLQLLHQGRPA
jgi:hypothetical protein